MEPIAFRHRFGDFPMLAGSGVVLRRVTAPDLAAIREISFYDGIPAASDAEALAILERIERDYASGDSIHWGICLQESDELVGTCGFYRGYPDNVGEIGYVLRPGFRGRGIMSAALALVVRFGFERMGLDGIVAYTDADNTASIGVLERLGFRRVSVGVNGLAFALDRPEG